MNTGSPVTLRRLAALVLAAAAVSTGGMRAQAPGPSPPDAAFYSVSYVEVAPASRSRAVDAVAQYRDASRRLGGFVRLELFEQRGRPGHLAFIETWKTQAAFDGRGPAAQALLAALQPIRLSGYDQRPYKTLSVPATPPAANTAGVVVITHVDVSPDPRVAPMLERLADASRREAGNLRFDVLQHTMRANHFTVIEVWRDEPALDAHAAAAHTRQYREDLQPLTGSPLDERLFTRIAD